MKNKYTLVINYSKMQSGGIEVTFASLMKYALEQGHRVIWLTSKKRHQKAMFREVIEHENLEIVYVSPIDRLLGQYQVLFECDENVIMLSSNPMLYILGEEMKRKACVIEYKHYLVIAHFTGELYYPERMFTTSNVRHFWKSYMARIIEKIEGIDCLRAFSYKHLTSYEDGYQIDIKEKCRKVIDRHKAPIECDITDIHRRCKQRREDFRIITVSRYDFPHKGYILGLLDTFESLKKKYPQMSLEIIGYGPGERQVKERIEKMDDETRGSIILPGEVDYFQLQHHFKNASLNIGLAGAVGDGARAGIPSLGVRHYSLECETYGYLENLTSEQILGEEPGAPIEDYIVEMINMPDEEYTEHCLKAVQRYSKERLGKKYNPNYFFEQNGKSEKIITRSEMLLGKVLFVTFMIKLKWKQLLMKLKKNNE